MRPIVLTAALLAVILPAACKPKERAPAEPAAVPAAEGACTTGRTLAETLVCDDGDPSIFRQVSPDFAMASPKCTWYTEQLMLNANEFLVFRNQDCSSEGWDGAAYAYVDGTVRINTAMAPEAAAEGEVILEIFFKAEDQTASDVALIQLQQVPEAERKRCIVRPVEDGPFAGTRVQLAPDDEFLAELTVPGGISIACGPYGLSDAASFFEDRGARVLFHQLGQDSTYWDPASFTFYIRDMDGKFVMEKE